MTELKNDRFLRALLKQPVDVTPVWMMRQAGRYLPEYRASRERAGDFMALCTNPELACEVTLQPLERYPLDAAILFSDILTIPDAMGLGLYFETGEGPKFRKPVRTEKDVDALQIIKPEQDLPYVVNAVKTIRRELNGRVPLIGFSGSPWTLATYMIDVAPAAISAAQKRCSTTSPRLCTNCWMFSPSQSPYISTRKSLPAPRQCKFLIPGAGHCRTLPIKSSPCAICRKSSPD